MTKQIIAVVNQKGGVGKTTSVINVAAYMSILGRKVLIIDLDPQGNATSGLGINREAVKLSSYNLILGHKNLEDVMVDMRFKNLKIIPSNNDLSGAEVEMVSVLNREYLLKNALLKSDFDYIFIDCPPSLGLLTINALTAADHILIPVQTEYYALEGLSQLLATYQAIKQSTNPDIGILGVILTMYDKRTTLSAQVKEEITKYFKDFVFDVNIPRNVRLAEAPSHGKAIPEHDKWSRGAKAYKNLTKEILSRLE